MVRGLLHAPADGFNREAQTFQLWSFVFHNNHLPPHMNLLAGRAKQRWIGASLARRPGFVKLLVSFVRTSRSDVAGGIRMGRSLLNAHNRVDCRVDLHNRWFFVGHLQVHLLSVWIFAVS